MCSRKHKQGTREHPGAQASSICAAGSTSKQYVHNKQYLCSREHKKGTKMRENKKTTSEPAQARPHERTVAQPLGIPLMQAGQDDTHLGIAQELRLVFAGLHRPCQRLARWRRAQHRLQPGLRRIRVSGTRERERGCEADLLLLGREVQV